MQTKDYGANHSKECKTVSSHVNVQYVSLWSCFLIWLSRIWYVALFSAKMAYVSYKLFLIKHNTCIAAAVSYSIFLGCCNAGNVAHFFITLLLYKPGRAPGPGHVRSPGRSPAQCRRARGRGRRAQ